MSLKVAIVGAGWMGETHAKAVAAAGDSVYRVIDADSARAARLAAIYGAQAGTELSEAGDCDAAVIATPSGLHLKQSEQLADLDLPLLVEKPHRFPSENAERLKSILARTGKPYQVGMTTRFNDGLRAISEALKRGELGDILSYSDRYWFQLDAEMLPPWYFEPATAGGGALLTNGVHILDRCRWLLGEGLQVSFTNTARLFDTHNVEDFAVIQGHTEKGRVAVNLSLLWTPANPLPSELAIVGTRGVASMRGESWSISTAHGERSGQVLSPDAPFATQWRLFRARFLGEAITEDDDPTLDMLERTLVDIARIYQKQEA